MTKRLGVVLLAAMVAVGICSPAALATFDLQITEIWPGNEPGSNLTEDWFELTNYGDMAWTAATDGDLYFDDDSFDAATADLLMGIASIAPGESVVFVDGDPDGATDWATVWGAVVAPLPQVGSYEGAGLGQGGDAIGIFLDDVGAGVNLTLYAADGYPDANTNGGQSYDTVLGAFSTVGNANRAVATIALNDMDQPAIGSPGSVVPEPAALLLVISGLVGVVLVCRR